MGGRASGSPTSRPGSPLGGECLSRDPGVRHLALVHLQGSPGGRATKSPQRPGRQGDSPFGQREGVWTWSEKVLHLGAGVPSQEGVWVGRRTALWCRGDQAHEGPAHGGPAHGGPAPSVVSPECAGWHPSPRSLSEATQPCCRPGSWSPENLLEAFASILRHWLGRPFPESRESAGPMARPGLRSPPRLWPAYLGQSLSSRPSPGSSFEWPSQARASLGSHYGWRLDVALVNA